MDKCFDKPRKDVSLHPKLLREHTFILILAMKKNVYFLLALLLIGLSACDNAPKFKVQGEINGAEDKMLYLEASGLDGIVALDSAKLGSSGSFSFAQKRPESPEFYRLRLDNKVINFAVDSTETVSVKAEINDFATAYRIEGSENNLKIKELVLLQADLQKNVDKLGQNRNIPAGIAQDSLLAMVNNYKNKVKREYIFAAPNMPYAYFALFQSLNGYMIFDPLTNKEDVKCFAAVATSLNNAYPHADRSRNLYNMVIKGMKNTRTPRQQTMEIPEDKIKEASIIDIQLKDLKGNTRSLTDLKGMQHDMTLCGCQCSVQHQQHNNSSDENHTCNAGCVTKFKSVTPDRAQDSVSPDYSFCLLLYTVTDVLALSLRLTEHNTLPYNYYLEKLHSTCLPHVKGLRAPPCDVLA